MMSNYSQMEKIMRIGQSLIGVAQRLFYDYSKSCTFKTSSVRPKDPFGTFAIFLNHQSDGFVASNSKRARSANISISCEYIDQPIRLIPQPRTKIPIKKEVANFRDPGIVLTRIIIPHAR
jgi:hypothetical protein